MYSGGLIGGQLSLFGILESSHLGFTLFAPFGLLLLLGSLALQSLRFFLCIHCIVCGENTMRSLPSRLTVWQTFGCSSVAPGPACMPRRSGVALVSSLLYRLSVCSYVVWRFPLVLLFVSVLSVRFSQESMVI